jgi:hypothetical protein
MFDFLQFGYRMPSGIQSARTIKKLAFHGWIAGIAEALFPVERKDLSSYWDNVAGPPSIPNSS